MGSSPTPGEYLFIGQHTSQYPDIFSGRVYRVESTRKGRGDSGLAVLVRGQSIPYQSIEAFYQDWLPYFGSRVVLTPPKSSYPLTLNPETRLQEDTGRVLKKNSGRVDSFVCRFYNWIKERV